MNTIYGYKMFPDLLPSEFNLTNTFSLHIIPEGYEKEQEFLEDATNMVNQLLSIKPFQLLVSTNNPNVSMYFYSPFETNTDLVNNGPQLITNVNNKPINMTLVDSYIDTSTNNFDIDRVKMLNVIENLQAKSKLLDGSILTTQVKDIVNDVSYTPNFLIQTTAFILLVNGRDVNSYLEFQYSLGANNQYDVYVTDANSDSNSYSNKNIGRFLAKILARHFAKLGDENIDNLSPSLLQQAHSNLFENLAVFDADPTGTYIPNPSFKWYKYLTNEERALGFVVKTAPTSTDLKTQNKTKIELWKGGGGFNSNIFRSSYDCIMKRTFDNNNLMTDRIKSEIEFCPICTKILERRLIGTDYLSSLFNRNLRTLNNQRSKFDEIPWEFSSTISIPINNFSCNENVTGLDEEYWVYDFDANGTVGLKLKNVKIKNQKRPQSRIVEEILNSIEFKNLKVKFFDSNDEEPFNISGAFNNKPTLYIAKKSNAINGKNEYQQGVKLVLKNDFLGTCNCTVELSVVFRSPLPDFDPGQMINALKIFPQITFTWDNNNLENPRIVEYFSGSIKMDVVTHHSSTSNLCNPFSTVGNLLELCTDSNILWDYLRKYKYHLIEPGLFLSPTIFPSPLHPQWSLLFDYYSTYEKTLAENPSNNFIEFIGAYGLDSDKFYKKRTILFDYPYPSTNNKMRVNKVERQGEYDNLHVLGDMGIYTNKEHLPDKILAAPFCTEDCFHLHWRWGILPELIGMVHPDPRQFWGWTNDVSQSIANFALKNMLIPPNQELTIKATNPGNGTSANKNKIIYYTSKIQNPEMMKKQVILEQGAAWAARIHDISKIKTAFTTLNLIDPIPSGLYDDENYLHQVYQLIRYFVDEPLPSYVVDTEMIPEGKKTITYNGNQIKLKQL